jgi:hypothetical protein
MPTGKIIGANCSVGAKILLAPFKRIVAAVVKNGGPIYKGEEMQIELSYSGSDAIVFINAWIKDVKLLDKLLNCAKQNDSAVHAWYSRPSGEKTVMLWSNPALEPLDIVQRFCPKFPRPKIFRQGSDKNM